MGKFKMKFKLTGLELEIEGDRADIPLMTQNIGTQFAGLLEPAANIAGGDVPMAKMVVNDAKPPAQVEDKPKSGRTRPKTGNASGGGRGSKNTITLMPDPERWGVPSQEWTGTDKSIWLLHVLMESGHNGGATANEVAVIFNEHFLHAGKLTRQNADSALRGVSTGGDALVNRSNIGKFTLLQKGISRASTLTNHVRPKAGV